MPDARPRGRGDARAVRRRQAVARTAAATTGTSCSSSRRPAPEAGGWTRELMPDGDPLDVVLVADTSGSMDAAGARDAGRLPRRASSPSSGEDDRFRLVAADVDAHRAVRRGACPATDENAAAALAFLDARAVARLDRSRSHPGRGSGDGRATRRSSSTSATASPPRETPTPSAWPSAFAGASAPRRRRPCTRWRAPRPTSRPVLEALASIGGGSVRRADGDPAAAAYGPCCPRSARPVLRDV